jgi:Mor family transcriptional regulator
MNDFYAILDTTIQAHLSVNAISHPLASTIAKSIITEIAERFGGQAIYLKNNTAERLAAKHKRIVAEYDGNNLVALAQKHQVTTVWLKKLLKRAAQNEPAR